jgi:hypothetical protein
MGLKDLRVPETPPAEELQPRPDELEAGYRALCVLTYNLHANVCSKETLQHHAD